MIRIISNVYFIWVVIHWWCIITATTAWTNHQRAEPHPKWISQVYQDDSSAPTVRQRQQRQKGLGSSKTDDIPALEATVSTSDTSIKVRALASFISMTMLEPMLAAGVPIEKIMSTTSSTSLDSSSAVSDDTVESRTTNTSLHQKEGDRIVSIEDTFDTGDIAPTIPLTPPTAIVDGHDDDTAYNSEAPITTSGTSLSPTTVESRPPSTSVLLIPPVPSVISTAFGRPLSVVQEKVPPLQPPQILTAATTTKEKVPPEIMAATTMVSDEDPYGE